MLRLSSGNQKAAAKTKSLYQACTFYQTQIKPQNVKRDFFLSFSFYRLQKVVSICDKSWATKCFCGQPLFFFNSDTDQHPNRVGKQQQWQHQQQDRNRIWTKLQSNPRRESPFLIHAGKRHLRAKTATEYPPTHHQLNYITSTQSNCYTLWI